LVLYELHILLANAGIKPPIVLVGLSYGGWLVRQAMYSSEVSGMLSQLAVQNLTRFF
jgi:hypothetical protein